MAAIKLGRLELLAPVMNAAGPWAASISQLKRLNESAIGAVVTKTFTLEPSSGNDEPNQYFGKNFSINNVGLMNNGSGYFVGAAKTLSKKKPIIASIYESDTKEFVELAKQAEEVFDGVELNLSCPNVRGKEPIAYRLKDMDDLLRQMRAVGVPIGVKLPPFLTESEIREVSQVISRHKVNHIVLLNTYPIAAKIINQKPALRPNDGIGGLGGAYYKPIVMGHVILFKKHLPDIPIVAVGGVSAKSDVREYLEAGASAVQVGTFIQNHGLKGLSGLLH